MALSQAGDTSAHEEALRQCSTWLHRYFRGRIHPDMVDDLVQETLFSVHRKCGTYDPARPFLPWLAAIARYRWIDRLRKMYRNDESDHTYIHESIDPEESIAAGISIDRLLQLLPEKQARSIKLVKIDGHSVEEAARIAGQSQSSVKMNIMRGIRKLSALVEED